MIKSLVGFMVFVLSQSVFAAADCPKAPESEWLSIQAMQKKIINEYDLVIKNFKVDGNCYEIYGWETTADGGKGNRVEIYFNPVNGEIVKKK